MPSLPQDKLGALNTDGKDESGMPGVETYLANAFTTTTPGCLEHAWILDLVATGQRLLHGMHTRLLVDNGRDVAPALLVRQADI